jgi:hypothetical protein
VYNDTLVLSSNRLTSANFGEITLNSAIKTILLNDNQLEQLIGFPTSEFVEHLDLSNNPLPSLLGMPVFPKLKTVSVKLTPFAHGNYYRLALLLAAPSLTEIDGLRVSREERKFAKSFPEECGNLARLGWNGAPCPPSEEAVKTIHSELTDQLLALSRASREKDKSNTTRSTTGRVDSFWQ